MYRNNKLVIFFFNKNLLKTLVFFIFFLSQNSILIAIETSNEQLAMLKKIFLLLINFKKITKNFFFDITANISTISVCNNSYKIALADKFQATVNHINNTYVHLCSSST